MLIISDPQDQPNYFVIEVSAAKITIVTVKQDGTVVNTFSISKLAERPIRK